MKAYECEQCHARIFFDNLICLSCQGELGYEPAIDTFHTRDEANTAWSPCAHRQDLGCNWLLADTMATANPDETAATAKNLCECCRFTIVIPTLEVPANLQHWRAFEQAKRYLFYSLISLHLPIPDRQQQPDGGLAFEFLADEPQKKVLTGHDSGIITINVAEADDVQREQRRVALHEPYRTLLGHLRHEIGHFYWDQLIADGPHLDEFRELFGDERADYAQALQRHYETLSAQNWPAHFVSAYASAHPWEDWAETWAHYLHITDALDTAASWGVAVRNDTIRSTAKRVQPDSDVDAFKHQVSVQWLPLCQYLNAASRSLGEGDAYPYVLTAAVIEKLSFVHKIVSEVTASSPTPTAAQDAA